MVVMEGPPRGEEINIEEAEVTGGYHNSWTRARVLIRSLSSFLLVHVLFGFSDPTIGPLIYGLGFANSVSC